MADPRRVLLTGGAGFVGASLARRLVEEGDDVLLRPGGGTERLAAVRDRVTLHAATLGEAGPVRRLVREIRPEVVFHLAVYGGYPHQVDVDRMIEANVSGTVHLLDACAEAGVGAVVSAGSSSEYGYQDHPPAESERLEPNSAYAATKAFGSHYSRLVAARSSLRTATLRLYSVFGPLEEPTRFVPTLVREGLAGRLPPLVAPETARDFVYVDDVCDAFLLAAPCETGEPGAVYTVGTGRQVTSREAVETARELFGIREEPSWGSFEARSWDTTAWVADPSKIRRELGWVPRHTFAEGLRKMADLLSENA